MSRFIRLSTVSALVLSLAAGPAPALPQQAPPPPPQDVVVNMRGADIRDVAEQISRITGRTLVLDPAVQGTVNVVSAEPLSRNGVWELFLQVLRTQGFAAVRSGNAWRIVPQASVLQSGGSQIGSPSSNLEVITRMIRLRNLPSDQAVRALRPLVSASGAIEALTSPNAVVVTDVAENIRRVQALAQALDQGGGANIEVVTLQHASAAQVAKAIGDLLGEQAGGARVSADERSNAVLIRGTSADVAQARAVAQALDRPGGAAPVTRVVRLSHGDAENIAEIVRGILGGEPSATNPVARSLRTSGLASLSSSRRGSTGPAEAAGQATTPAISGPAAAPAGSTGAPTSAPSGFQLGDVTVQAAPELNAIVMRGSPNAIAAIEDLVRQLDVRRPQVTIEAAIVEITGELGEQLGVQLGLGDTSPIDGGAGGTSFSNVGRSLATVLTTLNVPGAAVLSEGLSLAAGSEDEFGAIVQALGSTTSANLLSTPSITVLDNQIAENVVGQNVPFRTGSFATDGNSTNPFTTISREDVGLTLRVLPRVNDGDVVKLDVALEVSSLVNSTVAGAADLITNRRSIDTTVLADNGQVIVLGGLVTDDRQDTVRGVPGFSNIPGLGALFRSRGQTQSRRTLFIFLRPTILRDRESVGSVTADRFERLRAAEPAARPDGGPSRPAPQQPRLPEKVEGVF